MYLTAWHESRLLSPAHKNYQHKSCGPFYYSIIIVPILDLVCKLKIILTMNSMGKLNRILSSQVWAFSISELIGRSSIISTRIWDWSGIIELILNTQNRGFQAFKSGCNLLVVDVCGFYIQWCSHSADCSNRSDYHFGVE